MDLEIIPRLIELAISKESLELAREKAAEIVSQFPEDGCAANLSALLILAGAKNIRVFRGAGHLVEELEERHWERIATGEQMPGDVGVTYDKNDRPGADHVYLVVEVIDLDKMMIVDNQKPTIHERFVSGKGKTRTEFFLRAT